jgi:lysophospholipase L1-like esterase
VLTPSAVAANGGVLVVGDSLEVLTSPYLQRFLPGVTLTVNAQGGYNSYQIRELFEESYDPSQSVIVFDAGTNDNPAYPQILAENLAAVATTIGDRCMVVPTIHGLTVNGVDSSGKNQAVESFAASRPGTQVPDWARLAETHPELMQADDLHPIPRGAEYRARLIAHAVKACLAFVAPPRPVLQTAPNLPLAGKLAARQGSLLRATGLAVLLTIVSSYA